MDEYRGYVAYIKAEDAEMNHSTVKAQRNKEELHEQDLLAQRQNALEVAIAPAAAKLLQSCLTLCDPIDGSPAGSPVPGILQARVLEWGAIAFSNSS